MTIDKTLLTSMAERYRVAEKLCFAKMEKWKQDAILEDRKTGHESGLLNQFAKDVIAMAERMEIAPAGAKPPKAKKMTVEPFSDGKDHSTPPWHDKNGANGNEHDSIY